MTFLGMAVDIQTWDAGCGARPAAYSRQPRKAVEIREENGHLILSGGGVRTDACGTSNTSVHTVSAHHLPKKWTRICRTPNDDPRSEQGVYSLVVKHGDKLEYTAVTDIDWRIGESRCVATTTEQRIFIRGALTADTAKGEPGEANDPVVLMGCETPGPAKWVTIAPKRARLGPQQSVCFEATLRDQKGCIINEKPEWSTTQEGIVVKGLISSAGCFRAGKTAADAEGRYTVIAKVGGKSASAEVDVVFPEIDRLVAVHLNPLEEENPEAPESIEKSQRPSLPPATRKLKRADIVGPPSIQGATQGSAGSHSTLILLLLILAGVISAVTFVLFLRYRSRRACEPQRESDDSVNGSAELINHITQQTDSVILSMKCTVCGRLYKSDARFCPHDKSALVASVAPSDAPERGMICPKCFRGYSPDASFCPHDSEKLVPYAEWRAKKEGQQVI